MWMIVAACIVVYALDNEVWGPWALMILQGITVFNRTMTILKKTIETKTWNECSDCLIKAGGWCYINAIVMEAAALLLADTAECTKSSDYEHFLCNTRYVTIWNVAKLGLPYF
jgi:hypothetical protein